MAEEFSAPPALESRLLHVPADSALAWLSEIKNAAVHLRKGEWRVTRSRSHSGFDATGDPEFSARILWPVDVLSPPSLDSAFSLGAQTISAFLEAVPPEVIAALEQEAVARCAPDPEDYLLIGLRQHVCDELEAVTSVGAEINGLSLADPVIALTRIASAYREHVLNDAPLPVVRPLAPPALVEDQSSAAERSTARALGEAASVSIPASASHKGRPEELPRRAVKARVSDEAFRKALKYVTSNAMGTYICVLQRDPLSLTLKSGPNFAKRFDEMLSGPQSRSEAEAARSIALRAVKDVTERLNLRSASRLCPEIDWASPRDPLLSEQVSPPVLRAIKQYLIQRLDREGAEAFRSFRTASAPRDH